MKLYTRQITILLLIISFFSCGNDDDNDGGATPVPTLTSISPISGPKTTIVTINGSNFGDTTSIQVFFNDVEAVVQSVTETQIITIVPARAYTGLVKVVSNGTELTGQEFTYLISDVQVSTLTGSTLSGPGGVAIDAQGMLYVTDDDKVKKITPDGNVSIFAGSTEGFSDGTGTNAQFNAPNGIAIDAQGNVYVVDLGNDKIRKITPNGVVSTLAGSTEGFSDGTGVNAQFNSPNGIAIDAQGTLYVADFGNHRIRKITPNGLVSTLAGSTQGFADGIGVNAQFYNPAGIAIDAQGMLYVADTRNHKIRKITPSGEVSTLAGSTEGFSDGTGGNAQFNFPYDITLDALGIFYVADFANHRIRKITPNGLVSTLAGSTEGFVDGTGANAQFQVPTGVVVDSRNNVFVADNNNRKIRKITQE